MIVLIFLVLNLFSVAALAAESVCYGTTANGRLENSVKLPGSGPNYESYGWIPELAGRTYVHSKVRDVVVDAYSALEKEFPEKVFKYAETGYEEGGKFKPHKTHQNGLSIDFMVPVMNEKGKSVYLPTHPFNKYGYDIEFDKNGVYDGYRIDFEAMGAHIVALYKAAKNNGIGIWRVLFDPQLQPFLYSTRYGRFIRENIKIPNKRSWVRHDEHYHIDFKVPCKKM
jgi:penicillin-insensitive murein endopeptidase